MLGETLRPSVGKWNNTFNHMKQNTQDYFCTYFLSLSFLFHWITVSHFVFLSRCNFILSPSVAHTHTYLPLQMSTTINREFLLNPLYTQAHRHTVDDILQNKAYHSCRITPLCIPTKTCHYKTVQYNYNWFNSELCELLLVINIFLSCLVCIWARLISTHLFLHKCTREEHLRVPAVQPEPLTVTHSLLLPPSLSFCKDRCAYWQAIPSSISESRRRHCPSTTTLPASQQKTKTKTPRQAQQCVILGLTTPLSAQGQGSVQFPHRRAAALGHHQTKGWEWLLPKHVLLHPTGDGICCSYLN